MIDRRHALGGMIAITCRPALAGPDAFEAIEATLRGGTIAIAAIDLGTRRRIGHRTDQRRAFCSSIKLPLAAAVLDRIDAGAVDGGRRMAIDPAAVLPNSPVVQAAVAGGGATVLQLCEGAVTRSDNSAANLLFPLVGGPAGLTRFIRAHGGGAARSDRIETALNHVGDHDPRDSITPHEALGLLEGLLVRPGLSAATRATLIGWLVASRTGARRLRAGLPASWRVGDKTGTGPGDDHVGDWPGGDAVDLAIAWPNAAAPPILIACFVRARQASPEVMEAAHAAAARAVAAALR